MCFLSRMACTLLRCLSTSCSLSRSLVSHGCCALMLQIVLRLYLCVRRSPSGCMACDFVTCCCAHQPAACGCCSVITMQHTQRHHSAVCAASQMRSAGFMLFPQVPPPLPAVHWLAPAVTRVTTQLYSSVLCCTTHSSGWMECIEHWSQSMGLLLRF